MKIAFKIVLVTVALVVAALVFVRYRMPYVTSNVFEAQIVSWDYTPPKDERHTGKMVLQVRMDDGRRVAVVSDRRTTAKDKERIEVREEVGWFGGRDYFEMPPR